MNKIKRMQELAGIKEMKVINPAEIYYIQDWVKPWIEQEYDSLKDEFGEDKADAIYMLPMIQDDSTKNYITNQELVKFTEPGGDWDNWNKDSLLQFLSQYNIIKNSIEDLG